MTVYIAPRQTRSPCFLRSRGRSASKRSAPGRRSSAGRCASGRSAPGRRKSPGRSARGHGERDRPAVTLLTIYIEESNAFNYVTIYRSQTLLYDDI